MKLNTAETMNRVLELNQEVIKPASMKMGKHEYLVNTALGYYPYFSITLRQRIKQTKVINGIVTGEGGVSKSYTTSDICRTLSKNFDVDNIVFTYAEFMRSVINDRRGTPTEFDEPSYAMGKKEWYKELNKALVKTIESFRFKGKPLFIPIINKNLLDSDIRNYLLQFHVSCYDRGKARVYRIYQSPFKQQVYNYELCKLEYKMFDNNFCSKPSCLTCRKLNPKVKADRCPIFRARYERKKMFTQEERYEQALDEAEQQEYSKLTLDEIEAKVILHADRFIDVDKCKVDRNKLDLVLRRVLKLRIGHTKLYKLANLIEFDHPELLPEPPEIHKDNVDKVT